MRWIDVKEQPPIFPCLACDEFGNYPFVPMGIETVATKEGTKYYFDINKKNWTNELPRQIVAWMPLPPPYNPAKQGALGKTELTPEARALKNAYAREWRRKNPGKQAEYMRKSWNKKAGSLQNPR